jgi:hypothetical protein
MKARRIILKKDDCIEIAFKRPHQTAQQYSSVGFGEGTIIKEQEIKKNSGLRGTMKIHGPATIALIQTKKEKKTDKK